MSKNISSLILIFFFSCSSKAALRAGDNVIVGSRERKLCWFDVDLSSQPYKTLEYVFFNLVISLILIFSLSKFVWTLILMIILMSCGFLE